MFHIGHSLRGERAVRAVSTREGRREGKQMPAVKGVGARFIAPACLKSCKPGRRASSFHLCAAMSPSGARGNRPFRRQAPSGAATISAHGFSRRLKPWEEGAVRGSPGMGDTRDHAPKSPPSERGPTARGPAAAPARLPLPRSSGNFVLPIPLKFRGPVLDHPDNRWRRVFEGFGDDKALAVGRDVVRAPYGVRAPVLTPKSRGLE